MSKKLRTRTRYTFVGSDYSQQEPRILTAMSQDEHLLDAYENGKDMYATLGVGVYKNDYWDNMEHYQDGTKNEEGTKRRKKMKVLYLGISYGMGPGKLSESLGCTKEEAKQIIDDFYAGFPKVKVWMDESKKFAKTHGYVEDYWGRRRRLPNLLLDEYEVEAPMSQKFNPLLFSKGAYNPAGNVEKELKDKLLNCKSFKDKQTLLEEAKEKKLKVIDNGGFISDAEREAINARIQGSAATMTKRAMIDIYNDEFMKEHDFHLSIAVHDRL